MEYKGIKSNLANALKTILDQRETIENNLKIFINQLIENTHSESKSQLPFSTFVAFISVSINWS